MEFIVLDKFEKNPLATFYSDINYGGESQELPAGLYNFRQLTLIPKSVKLARYATFAAAEKTNGTGARFVLTEDVPDLSALPISPSIFALTGNAVGYSKGEQVATLNPGGYDISVLRERSVDKIVVPDGLIIRFSNGDSEAGARSFKEGEVVMDEELWKFSNVFVVLIWNQSELSEAELAMVAGGKGINVCGGKACAVDLGQDVCGGKACVVAVIPVVPLSP